MRGKFLAGFSCAALVLVMLFCSDSAVAVAARGWQTVTTLDDFRTGDALWPVIASDDNGNAIAVWEQDNGTAASVWANRYAFGFGWEGPVQISNASVDAHQPTIDMSGEGNAFAVWEEGDPQHSAIFVNRYVLGSGWQGPHNLSVLGSTYAGNPDVTCGRNGHAFAVWVEGGQILVDRFAPRYGWVAPVPVSSNQTSPQAPRIDADDHGNATVVWLDYPLAASADLWSNRYSSTSGWGTQTLVENNDVENATDPSVAMDNSGNAVVVWNQYVGSPITLNRAWGNRYDSDTGWGEPRILKNDTTHSPGRPRVAIDGSGNATVVFDLRSSGVWAIRCSASGDWESDAVHIPGTDGAEADLAVNEAGQAVVVWRTYRICSNTYEPTSGWSSVKEVASSSGQTPVVSIDRDGDAVAAWMSDTDDARWSVYANEYRAPGPPITVQSPVEGQETDLLMIWVSGFTDPGASVDINGVLVVVRPSDGTFDASVPLKYGNNELKVRSTLDSISSTIVVNVVCTNPVPGLQDQLNQTRNDLQDRLNQTRNSLQEQLNQTTTDLHDAKAMTQLFMVTTGVAAAVAVLVAVLYMMRLRKAS